MRAAAMRVSLFWRTFLLIGGLIVVSLLAALQLVRTFDRAPPEQQLAWEIASVVNLTRSALVSAQGERRLLLLSELARDEGVRVMPLEPFDRIEPLAGAGDAPGLAARLRAALGPGTRIAGSVNGDPGLWVSFDIDGDAYWLGLALERLERRIGPPWWVVATLAIGLSMLGALAISRLVNRPLSALAGAIGRVSGGQHGPALPEDGPSEIAELNRRFNRMAIDLAELESDRAVALAGISHDLRSPLTRLRMEIELSALSEEEKASMGSDIERIDRIVGKFVEYARTGSTDRNAIRIEAVDVTGALATLRDAYRTHVEAGELELAIESPRELAWRGDPLDLMRMLSNLLENALRHGRDPGPTPQAPGAAHVEVRAQRAGAGCLIEMRDHGAGVPQQELQRLLRPFARVDGARSDRGGSGLGLAIVNRLAMRYGGSCSLANHPAGGLAVTLSLPDAR